MQGMKFSPAVGWAVSIPAGTTAAATTPTVVALHDCRQVSWTVKGTGTVSGGTVKFESADTADFAGTWNEVDSIDLSSPVLTDSIYQASYPAGYGGFYRVRISANVTGGGSIAGLCNGLLQ